MSPHGKLIGESGPSARVYYAAIDRLIRSRNPGVGVIPVKENGMAVNTREPSVYDVLVNIAPDGNVAELLKQAVERLLASR